MLLNLDQTSTTLKTRIGTAAMRLVMVAYIVFAVLGLAGNGSALAGHPRLEMAHLRDDATQSGMLDALSNAGRAGTSADVSSAPLHVLDAPNGIMAGDVPAINRSSPAIIVFDWLKFLIADIYFVQRQSAFSTPYNSVVAELRQHLHRSVVLHL